MSEDSVNLELFGSQLIDLAYTLVITVWLVYTKYYRETAGHFLS